MTDENAPMTGSYEWLDEDRATSEVYADAVHPLCSCTWDLDRRNGETIDELTKLPAMRLIARRKGCPIHGAKGHV